VKFAKRCKELRKKLGLTQGEFAEMVGVAKVTVSHWEIGRIEPREPTRKVIEGLRRGV